jgi:hypothetical protein
MKNLTLLIATFLFCGGLFSQNITNTIPTNGNFIIKDATNTYFILQQSYGNVGIGSSSFDATNPERLLVDCGTTSSVNAIYAKGSINSYFQFNIRNLSSGTQSSADIVATANNGTETTNFMDVGINGSGYVYQAGNPIETGAANDCYILASGSNFYIVNNNASKDMLFLTGGTASTNERMRIMSTGNVGIGTSAPSYKFQVKISSSYEGHVTSTGTWASSSDVRFKKNIKPIANSLEYIKNLNPVRFDMKNEEDSKTGNHFGFIAQEMEKYLPELVGTDNEGMKSIEYATLTSILAGAVKEQQVIIESQNKDIEQLKADVQELKNIRTVQSAGMTTNGLNTVYWILFSIVAGSLAIAIFKKKSNNPL